MPRNEVSDLARRYYDNFDRKLLSDYVYGNRRIQEAIGLAIRSIPPGAKNILDLGVGLGWSTGEMSRHFEQASLLGIDLSPKLIEIARQLYSSPRIDFSVADVTSRDIFFAHADYDAIVLLDVYEHIPRSKRKLFHRTLKGVLNSKGTVVLTFPSVMHQSYIRERHPSLVQPVDEDVTYEDVGRLACDLGLRVLHYAHVSLGRSNDYVHAVLRDKPPCSKAIGGTTAVALETAGERRERVAKRLGVRVMRKGLIIRGNKGPRICIAAPQEPSASETFIRAHIENLPADVSFLHGGRIPLYHEGEPLLNRGVLPRLWRAGARRILHVREGHFEKKAVARFIERHGIRLVLAEFGPVGAGMFEACERTGVPLVVHFHGADAYAHKFIEGPGRYYPRLFSSAAAIIAVSRDMARQLRSLGAPEEKLHYNPCGVDTGVFQGSRPGEAAPIFVSVGRFVDKKAPLLTLLAFRRVVEHVPEASLVMIGDGPLVESCRQVCRVFALDSRVRFPGVLPHVDVAEAMRKARAFVQHSIRTHEGDSEGTPVAVIEAGASGLPTVATRHGGIEDVVRHGETGYLVAEADVEDMARRMLELAEAPELADRMGQAARKRIQAGFSMEKSIDRLWAILEAQMRDR